MQLAMSLSKPIGGFVKRLLVEIHVAPLSVWVLLLWVNIAVNILKQLLEAKFKHPIRLLRDPQQRCTSQDSGKRTTRQLHNPNHGLLLVSEIFFLWNVGLELRIFLEQTYLSKRLHHDPDDPATPPFLC